jgi:hypothetical protein
MIFAQDVLNLTKTKVENHNQQSKVQPTMARYSDIRMLEMYLSPCKTAKNLNRVEMGATIPPRGI